MSLGGGPAILTKTKGAVMPSGPAVQSPFGGPQAQSPVNVSSAFRQPSSPNSSSPSMSSLLAAFSGPQQQQAPLAAAPASAPPPSLSVTGANDPAMQEYLKALRDRTAALQAKENAPVTASAERATDLANRNIYGAAAGQRHRMLEELSASGMGPGAGVGGGRLRAVDEAAQVRSARAGSDIALGRERDQDALNAQREGAVNSLYGSLGSASQVPFQQSLAASNQALNAWQAQDRSTLDRANLAANQQAQQQQQQNSQLQMWMSLMRGM